MTAQPIEVRVHEPTCAVEIHWNDDVVTRTTFLALRRACRCSGCEHRRRGGAEPEISPDVALTDVEPMGGSGLRLRFSDGHDRGLYPWPYLRELGNPVAESTEA